MTGDEASNSMTDKPRLQVADGGHAKFERRIFNLIISPDRANNDAEFDRLLAILKRRGDLSLVLDGQDGAPDHDKTEQGDKE